MPARRKGPGVRSTGRDNGCGPCGFLVRRVPAAFKTTPDLHP